MTGNLLAGSEEQHRVASRARERGRYMENATPCYTATPESPGCAGILGRLHSLNLPVLKGVEENQATEHCRA